MDYDRKEDREILRKGGFAEGRYGDELHDLFRQFQAEERVIMRYETLVFLARRRALVSPTATE